MTGFGSGEAPLGAGRAIVEARSLNHRFLELRVNLPEPLLSYASFVEQQARARLHRGRYDVTVRMGDGGVPPVVLDVERARALYHQLAALRDELAPEQKVPVVAITGLPGVLRTPDASAPEEIQAALAAALHAALDALDEMRTTEGRALAADLARQLAAARASVDAIDALGDVVVDAARQRLKARIERLLEGTAAQLDEGRLELEVALLADRSDVREELVRLRSHFAQFEALCASSEPVGRKLDFLLQEMGREANTIGSKSQDATLSQHVIDLKASLGRLREQVQNVE